MIHKILTYITSHSDHMPGVAVVMWVSLVTLTLWRLTSAHPQCLDFLPPFELSQNDDIFCDDYTSFGCCTVGRNIALKRQYEEIIQELSDDGLSHCMNYIKTLVCQECSPYAAHIYDAETTLVKRPLVGMCEDYCLDFYRQCWAAVEYLTDDPVVLSSLGHEGLFCGNNALPDVQYCYPDILTNSDLNQDLTRSTVTEEGCLCLETFARDLRNPLIFRSPDDQSGLIYVGTQIGVIYIYRADGSRETDPFLNLTDIVLTTSYAGDERGLLGLAFHPDYKNNGRFFLYFSVWSSKENRQQIRISEFHRDSVDPYKANRTSERLILEVNQPFGNHNGGELLFGVDGYLYAFLGDGGAGGDPLNSGQDRSTLLGSVLRLDIDSSEGSLPYSIPTDNPFVQDPGSRPEIYAYGIRNIWRCDVDDGDPVTGYGRGRIFCGDVGQSGYEEIDIIKKGQNYGWNSREGFHCYKQDKCGKIGPEELPIHAYNHSVGNSVTGGHVYRGCLNPNLQGLYIYGDYGRGRLFRLKETFEASNSWENKEINLCGDDVCFNGLTNQFERHILSFGEDFNGEIYILTTSQASSTSYSGNIYKIVDPRRRGDESLCRSSSWDNQGISTASTTTPGTTTSAPTTSSTPTTTASTTGSSTSTSSTTTASISTTGGIETVCADIAFILDASGSVGKSQFKGDLLEFVLSQIHSLLLGPTSFQVGVITFGNKATINIPLNKSYNHSELEELVRNIRYKDENTNTSGALRVMRRRFFSSELGSRDGNKKIGILLTDGKSTYDKAKTIPEARKIHQENIEMYVISFGDRRGLDQTELEEIASTPVPQHLLHQDRIDSNKVTMLPWTASTARYSCTHQQHTSTSASATALTSSTSVPSTSTMRTTSQKPRSTSSSSSTLFTTTLQKLTTLTKLMMTSRQTSTTKEPPLDVTTTAPSTQLWSCDFENDPPQNPWCGMVQSLKDKFNWSLTNHETPSHPTGPESAQNGNYYIYIETSNPRKVNDTAVIYLPTLTYDGDLCLTFYVHMYGFHVREIQVIIEKPTGDTRVAWYRRKEQGNFWFNVQANLMDIEQGDKIGFVGIRGEEYSGDIALDNIHLYTAQCPSLTL